eukprot:783598-Rhodomonas_salina.2
MVQCAVRSCVARRGERAQSTEGVKAGRQREREAIAHLMPLNPHHARTHTRQLSIVGKKSSRACEEGVGALTFICSSDPAKRKKGSHIVSLCSWTDHMLAV